jgi:alkanesulfonate monooxygenase SsuD/methylene tetrahydromethanopterin reductase-like flavin-dependent oxidoreductase (luciferase family)
VHLRLTMHIGETDAEAQNQARESIMAGYQKLITQLEGSPNARRRAELADVRSLTYEAVMRDKVVIGSPDTVAARLSDLRDQLGIDGILAELNFGALLPPEHMMRSCELLLREVRPRLRSPG